MTDAATITNVASNDHATCGPVRGIIRKIVCRIAPATTAWLLASMWTSFAGAAPQPASQDVGSVLRAVERYFAAIPDYQNGDLVTRSQIERLL